jgi:hypothetical protein
MTTTCTECGHNFTASQALCDDWRDPKKSFGCPNCGTFFIKDMRTANPGSLAIGLAGGGIITPALFIFVDGLRQNNEKITILAGVIILTVFGILISRLLTLRDELVKSPYQGDANNQSLNS